jgi:hypothetical protein
LPCLRRLRERDGLTRPGGEATDLALARRHEQSAIRDRQFPRLTADLTRPDFGFVVARSGSDRAIFTGD